MATLKQKLARTAAIGIIVLTCIESASCVASWAMAEHGILYRPPRTPLASYLAQRDPELGWTPPAKQTAELDPSGSRVVPSFPNYGVLACATIYGDSFAWSDEVDARHAWGNVLAQRAGCRVSNFGVQGYGTDQALLRYRRNPRDHAPLVLVGVLSENILRNVNRLRNLISPTAQLAFKPRFIVDAEGKPTLIPIATPSDEADLRAIVEHPEQHLEHEYFVPGGPAGISPRAFPFTLSVVRGMWNYRLAASIRGEAAHAAFYRPDHPSGGLRVTAGILGAFVEDASSRGATAIVVLVPLVSDFKTFSRSSAWPYTPLLKKLDEAKIPYLNSGEPLLEALAGRDPCSIYLRCAGGHFNEEGYRLLGEAVHAFLKQKGKL